MSLFFAAWFWIWLFLHALIVASFWSQKLEVLVLAESILMCFLSNVGVPGGLCSLQLTLYNLKSPQQRELPLCHLRDGLSVEQTSLLAMLPMPRGRSTSWIGLIKSPHSYSAFHSFLWVILLRISSRFPVFGAFGDLLILLAMSLFR